MMITPLHLLITYAIFSLFFVLIASLGGMVVYSLQKYGKRRWNLTLLEYCFISFAVGIILYIFFGYILSFFKVFNFYTAYLPFLIIAVFFLYFLYRNKTLHGIWSHLKKELKSNRKELITHGLIIAIIFLIQFITYWSRISESSSLLVGDPYYWMREIMFLNENGMVNYLEHNVTYPWGFEIYCSGNLMISPDFATTYYFLKLACFPYINLYVLILYTISRRLFKEKFILFFCVLSVLSNNYFLFRILSFISSSLAVLLILILLIIILTDIPNYFIGFILPATFLFNPAYSLFILFALIIFFSYEIMTSQSKRSLIFKEIGLIALLSLFFLSVYVFSVIIIFEKNLLDVIEKFFEYSVIGITTSLTSNVIEETTLFNLILGVIYYITFSILPLIAIIIRNRDIRDQKERTFYHFIKICVLLMFGIIYIIPIFIKTGFINSFRTRIFEAFTPCIILLSGVFIYKSKFYLENKWQKLKTSKVKFNNWINSVNFFNRILNFPNLIIFTVIFVSFLNLIYVRDNLKFDYRFEDSLIVSVFYVENNIEVSSNIGVAANYRTTEFQEMHSPLSILYKQNLFSYSEESNLTITEFTNFWQTNNVGYFIIKLSDYNVDLSLHIENETIFERLAGGIGRLEFQLYRIL
ncbi:MAG: hypothetical protein ACTSWK_04970 [Promethearchaeota archaeon]